jgi:large exoprotein involved in heme utilization and adhesion
MSITDSESINTSGGFIDTKSPAKQGGNVILAAFNDIITGDIESNGELGGGNISLISEHGNIDTTTGTLKSSSVNGTDGAIALNGTGDILTGNIISNGGNISLNSDGVISGTGITVDSTNNTGTGNSGDINVTARSLLLSDGARLLTRVVGNNQGGDITVRASESIRLSGLSVGGVSSGLFATSDGTGEPGKLTVYTPKLILQGRARILTEAFAAGKAGELTINTDRLILRDGARISALTSGEGNGGTVTVNASESVELVGTSSDGELPSALTTASTKTGNAGNLTINTGRLIVKDGAIVAASTLQAGQGGDLTVNASLVELSGTSEDRRIFSGLSTDTTGVGKAGNLTINTDRLTIRDGAGASASTIGQGQGGSLTVSASSIELSGTSGNGISSGLYAQTFAAGRAGNLIIHTEELIVRDRARITVSASNVPDTGIPTRPLRFLPEFQIPSNTKVTGDAGNIEVTARSILLDNKGAIIAQTESSEGGNITLKVEHLLLMRHNSLISATAGTEQAGGNGGNIRINAPLIVAVPKEDSDISANAYTGNGGRVQITAQGIFGTQFRPRLTSRSDITASSEFGVNGIVEINTPDIDPARGLANLPTETASPEVSQVCQPGANQASSEFVITGRGGKPPSPSEPLNSNAGWVDSRSVTPRAENRSGSTTATQSPRPTSLPLVEAQGWVYNDKGEVELVAKAPTVIPYSSWSIPATCNQGRSVGKK